MGFASNVPITCVCLKVQVQNGLSVTHVLHGAAEKIINILKEDARILVKVRKIPPECLSNQMGACNPCGRTVSVSCKRVNTGEFKEIEWRVIGNCEEGIF